MAKRKFEPSQLRELYDALCHLREGEQMALASFYVDDKSKRLVERFKHSCIAIAGYPENAEQKFHDRTPESEEKAIGTPPSVTEIQTTEHMQGYLLRAAGDLQEVKDNPQLAFRYVDREVFALRTTAEGGWRPPRRTMDLLLANTDGLPIVGEVKIGNDQPTFFALIQALMYASELSSPAQRDRLRTHYKKNGLLLRDAGPWLDVYVIGFQRPTTGVYREDSFEASRKISANLMKAPAVNGVIRRLAYLEAVPSGERLTFEAKFSFPEN